MRRSRRMLRTAAFAPALAFALGLNVPHASRAQGTTPAGTAPPVRTLTLQDVVSLAVNNNSSVVLARLRLRKQGYQIAVTNAQARPQITSDVLDTYDSLKTFGTSGGANVSSPTLPGGGSIPTITDQGGGTTTTFVGGGGGGTTSSSGTAGSTTSGSAASTTSGTNVTTGVSGGGVTGAGAARVQARQGQAGLAPGLRARGRPAVPPS